MQHCSRNRHAVSRGEKVGGAAVGSAGSAGGAWAVAGGAWPTYCLTQFLPHKPTAKVTGIRVYDTKFTMHLPL